MDTMTGLVLEGGGMRGLFTCGVLDCLLDHNKHFKYLIGVSAGATNGTSFISKQHGRTREITRKYVRDYRYMSMRSLFLTGSYFGMDFMFDAIPNKLVPFDFDRFYNEPVDYRVGVTDCITGETRYYGKADFDRKLTLLRATCSLPLISPIVWHEGIPLLDGGVSDPIPVRKALEDGCDRVVVVLTRDASYQKEPLGNGTRRFMKLRYGKYPKLQEALENRHRRYNETLGFLEELERQGKAFVIRPAQVPESDRLENDPEKLDRLYLDGMAVMTEQLSALDCFLNEEYTVSKTGDGLA